MFILNNQFPAFDQKAFTTAAICSEAGKTQTKTSVFEIIRGRAEDWRVMEDLSSQCNSKTETASSGILAEGGTSGGKRQESFPGVLPGRS